MLGRSGLLRKHGAMSPGELEASLRLNLAATLSWGSLFVPGKGLLRAAAPPVTGITPAVVSPVLSRPRLLSENKRRTHLERPASAFIACLEITKIKPNNRKLLPFMSFHQKDPEKQMMPQHLFKQNFLFFKKQLNEFVNYSEEMLTLDFSSSHITNSPNPK